VGIFLGHLRRMNSHFGGWESKDQPAVPGINMTELEDIAKELAVSLGICAVEDDMSPRNRHLEYRLRLVEVLTASLSD